MTQTEKRTTPPELLRRLALPTKDGGKKAESEYGDFHRVQGTQWLRKKYRGGHS